jgi:hypothetical protein
METFAGIATMDILLLPAMDLREISMTNNQSRIN